MGLLGYDVGKRCGAGGMWGWLGVGCGFAGI